jgi:hypothetical protein
VSDKEEEMEMAVYTHDETGKRVDVHRPSAINPGDYEYQSVGQHRKAVKDGENPYSGGPAGTCHHCGKWIVWEVHYLHKPSGNRVTFGYICAGILDLTDNRIDHEMVLLQRKAANEREQWKFEKEAREKLIAFQAEQPVVFNYLNTLDDSDDNYFLQDMRRNLKKWGNLFPNQINAVIRIKEGRERAAVRKAEEAELLKTAPPLTAGRQTLTGEILSTKLQDSMYGTTLKMRVRLDNGNTVYGTVPNNLYNELGYDGLKGAKITFEAEVQVKEDHFGYFKRPTKVKVV